MLWSVYRSFTEVVNDDNPLLQKIRQPGVGSLLAPGSPLIVDGASTVRPAPAIGADTGSVLTERLGLSADDVRSLAERGVVGSVS